MQAWNLGSVYEACWLGNSIAFIYQRSNHVHFLFGFAHKVFDFAVVRLNDIIMITKPEQAIDSTRDATLWSSSNGAFSTHQLAPTMTTGTWHLLANHISSISGSSGGQEHIWPPPVHDLDT